MPINLPILIHSGLWHGCRCPLHFQRWLSITAERLRADSGHLKLACHACQIGLKTACQKFASSWHYSEPLRALMVVGFHVISSRMTETLAGNGHFQLARLCSAPRGFTVKRKLYKDKTELRNGCTQDSRSCSSVPTCTRLPGSISFQERD